MLNSIPGYPCIQPHGSLGMEKYRVRYLLEWLSQTVNHLVMGTPSVRIPSYRRSCEIM